MKRNKTIIINMNDEEYNKAIEYKETHGRPTWREMIFDLIEIKKEKKEQEE